MKCRRGIRDVDSRRRLLFEEVVAGWSGQAGGILGSDE